MKVIVTHYHPDVDAVTAIWLLKSFYPGWQEADIAFVPAGETLNDAIVDSDPDVLHVDTGLGRFDHHQTAAYTSAAKLVFEFLKELRSQRRKKQTYLLPWHKEALTRLTNVIVDIDHFGHVHWPKPTADIYDFTFEAMLDGWKLQYKEKRQDRQITEWGMRALDGIYRTFINKIWAEAELEEKAVTFETRWGKVLAIESVNDDTLSIAQKRGYIIAVRKDSKKGYVRIKARPASGCDLTPIFKALKKWDSAASWYLHVNRLMILNGSTKNPKMKATRLSLKEIIDIIKSVK